MRVVAQRFVPGRSQKKLLARHADLEVHACEPWATEEQWALLRRYLATRHPDGGMAAMDGHDYADMVEQSPVDTVVVEYREPGVDGRPGREGCDRMAYKTKFRPIEALTSGNWVEQA